MRRVNFICGNSSMAERQPSKLDVAGSSPVCHSKCHRSSIGRAADLSIKLSEINMGLTSKQKGNLTELQCLAAFMEQGCGVSVPYGDNSKYDFIADVNGKLLKIQVKTSSLKDEGAIKFSCRSTHVNSSEVKNERYSSDDIDFFATYWGDKCYLIPIAESPASKTLRFVAPQNGQIKGVSFAKDYELERQLQKVKEEVAEH